MSADFGTARLEVSGPVALLRLADPEGDPAVAVDTGVTATDTDGNTVRQTVVRAYQIGS